MHLARALGWASLVISPGATEQSTVWKYALTTVSRYASTVNYSVSYCNYCPLLYHKLHQVPAASLVHARTGIACSTPVPKLGGSLKLAPPPTLGPAGKQRQRTEYSSSHPGVSKYRVPLGISQPHAIVNARHLVRSASHHLDELSGQPTYRKSIVSGTQSQHDILSGRGLHLPLDLVYL